MKPAKQMRAQSIATHASAPVLTSARGRDKSAKCGFLGVFRWWRGDLRASKPMSGERAMREQETGKIAGSPLAFGGPAQ